MCMGEGEITPKHRARITAGIWMNLLGNLGTAIHRYLSSVATEGPYLHAAYRERAYRSDALRSVLTGVAGGRPPRGTSQRIAHDRAGGILTAVRSALQFAALRPRGDLGTEPASYVTTGVHTTFELMVSTFGRNPTSSFVLCSLFSDALDLPQEACLDFPRTGEWKAAATHYLTGDLIARHHTQTPKSETIHWTSRSSLFGGP